MKLTTEETDELVSIVCDLLCKHPVESESEEELEGECENCPLVDRLMKGEGLCLSL